jgi:hypothetical protein
MSAGGAFRQVMDASRALLVGASLMVFPDVGAAAGEGTAPSDGSLSSAFGSTLSVLAAKPGEDKLTVTWDFTNRLDVPLMVERFEASCGCLSGVVDNKAVAPGATGRISATFAVGAYRGKVRKSLHVRFAAFDKPVELVAEVTVPSAVELSSSEFVWKGADVSPRTVDVKAGTDAGFTITGLAGASARAFSLEQQTVTPGRHYRVTITPAGDAAAAVECLQIRTDSADLRDRVLAVFLRTKVASADEKPTTVPSP